MLGQVFAKCLKERWKIGFPVAERREKQQVGSLSTARSSRKLCGLEALASFQDKCHSYLFRLSAFMWLNPKSSLVISVCDCRRSPVLGAESQAAWTIALSHRHCYWTACHTAVPVLLSLQDRILCPALVSNEAEQEWLWLWAPLCTSCRDTAVCSYLSDIILLNYHSYYRDSFQGSFEPHVSKSGGISFTTRWHIWLNKSKHSHRIISLLIAAACYTLYTCLWAHQKDHIKILHHS